MSAPVLARTDEASGGRFYEWKGERYWSVTTLIGGGVPKFGLAPWYGKVVAELVTGEILARGPHARAHAAIRRWARLGRADVVARQAVGELTSIKLAKLTELDLALRHLKGEPVRVRDAAGDLGSDVHSEAETLVLRLALDTAAAWEGERPAMPDWPDELLPHMRSFVAWLEEWRPVFDATEATVFSRAQAFGGTLDAILRVDRQRFVDALIRSGGIPSWLDVDALPDPVRALVDYKSGRNVHPEVGMQLSAYARGEFVASPDRWTEFPMPAVDVGMVLHITPKGAHFRPVRIDDVVFDAFRFARELYRWSNVTARTVIAPALLPAGGELG